MYNFLLQIALMLGAGIMVYIFARAVPRVSDEVETSENKLEKLLGSLPLEKLDAALALFLEKTIRRTRLVLIKLENMLGGYLRRVKRFERLIEKNGEKKPSLFDQNSNSNDDVSDANNEK